MNIHETLDMKGRLVILKRNRGQDVVEQVSADNDIVLSGRDLVAKLFINETVAPVSHLAVGTGTTAVNPAAVTALANELFRKLINPVNPGVHLVTIEGNKKKVTITTDLDFTEANGALTEAGLFNAESGGIMYNRVVFPPVNKTTDFTLTLIWEIIF